MIFCDEHEKKVSYLKHRWKVLARKLHPLNRDTIIASREIHADIWAKISKVRATLKALEG